MFRILSLDGGGIRGVFSAAFLAEVEKHLERPLASYFDLIAGTSTGGIIALALGMGRPAAEIEKLYLERAGEIFEPRAPLARTNSSWRLFAFARRLLGRRSRVDLVGVDRQSFDSLFQAKYQPDGLARVLYDEFGDAILEEATRRLIVPAVDMLDGKTVVFKTPHLPGLTRDRYCRVRDIALATSSAPTYFPAHAIKPGHAYVDGGLWANNPAMAAYAEAVKIWRCRSRPEDPEFALSDIRMLSVGTGLQRYSAMPSADAGLAWWGPRLLNTMMSAQSQGISFQADYVMGDNHVRCNFEPEDQTWSLDGLDKIDRLARLGQQRAAEFWTVHHRTFFTSQAPPPTWYPPGS